MFRQTGKLVKVAFVFQPADILHFKKAKRIEWNSDT